MKRQDRHAVSADDLDPPTGPLLTVTMWSAGAVAACVTLVWLVTRHLRK